MVTKYTQSERRDLWKLFNMGRNSNEFHRALFLENADRNIIIDRKKKKDFNIIRSIFEFFHVVDNGDSIVFDFDMLLVNMTMSTILIMPPSMRSMDMNSVINADQPITHTENAPILMLFVLLMMSPKRDLNACNLRSEMDALC